jgi:hypothetical protein
LKSPPAHDFLKILIMSANSSIKFYQGLIDEWDDPKDVIQRSAQLLKKSHQKYAKAAYLTLGMLEKKSGCKHPKKYQDICEGVKYCCNCNEDLEIVKPKVKKKL